jgi:HAD superfamily hydrolase (TIGR01509 family)
VITHILFDNDGILVDTEQYYLKSSQDVLSAEGFNLTEELFIEYSLTKGVGVWDAFPNSFSEKQLVELRAQRDSIYNRKLQVEPLEIDGAREVIEELTKSFKLCLVTSALKNDFLTIHKRTGFLKYFEFYLANGDYPRSKPDPSPYLMALDKFGITAENALVVEDTQRGVIAAKKAGIKTVVIPNSLNRKGEFKEADYRLDSIKTLHKLIKDINSLEG